MTNDKKYTALRRRLLDPCFEIIPLKGIEKEVHHIPPGSDVAITCSPIGGVPETLALARAISDRGFTLIPHIAARMVTDEAHLCDILKQVNDLGIDRIFVIGGDAEKPVGRFGSSLQILELMATLDHGIKTVGIAGYPEGHPLINDMSLLRSLQEKQQFATYIVTQMCFDHEVIGNWIRRIRSEGVDLPVHLGVPGVAERKNLLRIALKIGVGQSAKFLKSNLGLLGRMMAPGGYSPDELLLDLEPLFDTTPSTIEGVHVYTMNQVESTEKWRAEMLARLGRGEDTNHLD